ncbi:MAG: Crp/Fnr family transcriptional regulator [Bacillota bacterium]
MDEKSKYFVYLSSEEQEVFRQYAMSLVFPKEHTIFSPGDLPNYIYFIEAGKIRIYRITMDGEYITISIRHSGEICGLAEALCDMPRQCFATTLEITRLLAIKKEDFSKIILKEPQLGLKVTQVLSRRLRHAETIIHDLVHYNVEARLARLLLSMAKQCGRNHGEATMLDIVLTHKDIASMIGTSRQTVTSTLQQLKDRGIIDYHKREIIIMDFLKLRSLT